MAPARVDPARAGRRRRRTSSTTSRCRSRRSRDFVAATDAALAARLARHPPGRLRPPRRRQPALQRAGPGRRRRARVPRRHEARGQRASSTTRSAPRGGSISAEHGIGALKLDELAQRKSPVALAMMRAIKARARPRGVLNPGRVLPPASQAVKARTSGLPRRAGRDHHAVAARRDDGVGERRDQLLRFSRLSISGTRPSATPWPATAAWISWSYEEKCSTPAG